MGTRAPGAGAGSEEPNASPPRTIRLPGFLVEEEIGLGEVIKRATSWAGVRPCGGCARRAAALDRRVVVVPRTTRQEST